MTKRTKRIHSTSFKAKVALAVHKGNKTAAEIVQQYEVHSNQVTEWKRQLVERAAGAFDGGASKDERDEGADLKLLHAKIGQQALESNFLSGALTKTGLLSAKN